MAKEICASRSSARTLCALQGLIRRKSAQFEASVVSTNWRCKAARVCSLSQTSEASQRSRKCWRCGSERDSINGSRKAHNFGELCTIFVGIGRCSCWNKVSCEFTAYSGDALCGKRQPTSFESANSKSLTEKVKKAAKMAGFSRLFSPMSSNSDDKSRKDFRTTLIRRGAHIANVVVAVNHGYLGAEPTQTPRQSAYAHEKLGFRADRNPRRVSTRSQNHSEMGESVDQASGPCSRGNPPRTVDWQKPSPL